MPEEAGCAFARGAWDWEMLGWECALHCKANERANLEFPLPVYCARFFKAS